MPSLCSAHPLVVKSAARWAKAEHQPILIEATCNQVNQFGGYTGMTPADFHRFVSSIASQEGLALDQVILGGDHLGPNPWRKEVAEVAMTKAEAMVEAYVEAGFNKIYLDASMGCAGEPVAHDDETTARRAARLVKAAERVALSDGRVPPVYVIGTEVPVPGGADHAISEIQPTSAAAARQTIAVHREIFTEEGLGGALDRVIAVVVQPGVEFGNENVIPFRPELARDLSAVLDEEPNMVFEAHSTDYQSGEALAALVRNGFQILKVGPGLTFALREALYGLDLVASELVEDYGNRPLASTMEAIMVAAPDQWKGHYYGTGREQYLQRHFSYSDRIRYYWTTREAEVAVGRLLDTLKGVEIPETLMAQYLPRLDFDIASRRNPERLLMMAVKLVIADYAAACRQNQVASCQT